MNRLVLFLYLVVGTTLLADMAAASGRAAELLEWQFEVRLDERPIGQHIFRVEQSGDIQRVESEAGFDVKFLFFNAYRYRHQNVEIWRDGCLERIDAETDANGKPYQVRGMAVSEAFRVETNDSTDELPACVRTFAYWHADLLDQARLLNSQTGAFEDVQLREAGRDTVRVGGDAIAAKRYQLIVKDNPIALWYAEADGRWLALETQAAGGRTLRYEPLVIPRSSPSPLQVAAQ